jgi:hypothetical protein
MTHKGNSFSKTDLVKREMSFGIDKKKAWEMVSKYWKPAYYPKK